MVLCLNHSFFHATHWWIDIVLPSQPSWPLVIRLTDNAEGIKADKIITAARRFAPVHCFLVSAAAGVMLVSFIFSPYQAVCTREA